MITPRKAFLHFVKCYIFAVAFLVYQAQDKECKENEEGSSSSLCPEGACQKGDQPSNREKAQEFWNR